MRRRRRHHSFLLLCFLAAAILETCLFCIQAGVLSTVVVVDDTPLLLLATTAHNEHDDDEVIWEQHGCHVLYNICRPDDNTHDGLVQLVADNSTTNRHDSSIRIYKSNDMERSSYWEIPSYHPSSSCSATTTTIQRHAISHHVVLFGLFSSFLMEFYLRIVSVYYEIHQALLPTITSTKFYSALASVPPPIQHVFLQGFVNNNNNSTFDSLNVLFPKGNERRTATSSCPHNTLECMDRFILCGYQEKIIMNDNNNNQHQDYIPRDMISQYRQVRQRDWQGLKTLLRQRILLDRPDRMGRIQAYRNKLVVQQQQQRKQQQVSKTTNQSYVSLEENSNDDNWKIVGFSQRTSRRRWINLPAILDMCRKHFTRQHKIICVQVNMDSTFVKLGQPDLQAIVHGSLDALIGIHGSQQTHAIWMKPHSYMLELLPYLLPGEPWGKWTQATHAPTLNGIFTQGTDVMHVGHPMGLESIVNCSAESHHSRISKTCNDGIPWDDRDFVVNVSVVESFLKTFIVPASNTTLHQQPWRSCDDYTDDLVYRQEFVLYNVPCMDDDSQVHYKQFFRPRSSFPHLQKYSGVQQYEGFHQCLSQYAGIGKNATTKTLPQVIQECGYTLKELIGGK